MWSLSLQPKSNALKAVVHQALSHYPVSPQGNHYQATNARDKLDLNQASALMWTSIQPHRRSVDTIPLATLLPDWDG